MGSYECVTKRFNVALDIKRSVSNREFEVVEDDNGNILHIALTDDGNAVDLTDCRVLAIFSKSTGTSSQDSAAAEGGIEIGGNGNNEITIRLFTASFAPGMVECEVQVYSGLEQKTLITSAKFNFNCRRGILNAETIKSTDEYPLLIDLIARVELAEGVLAQLNDDTRLATDNANAAAQDANDAAQYARDCGDYALAAGNDAENAAQNANAAADSVQGADEAADRANEAADRANAAAENAEGLIIDVLPTHADFHAAGGVDPLSPADIGAQEEISATGILKGTGNGITQAISGTDFAAPSRFFASTLLALGWQAGKQTVNVNGLSSSDNGSFELAGGATLTQYDAWIKAKTNRYAQTNGSFTVQALGEIPNVDVPIEITIVG